MDLFELLKRDHRKVSGLFEKLLKTSDGAAKTRQSLFAELKMELELHAEVEEAYFYPALEQHPETKDQVPEALEEHNEVKEMLADLAQIPPDDAVFLERLQDLRDSVQHHVEEEEHEIFPAAKEALSQEEIALIGEQITAMKSEEKSKTA